MPKKTKEQLKQKFKLVNTPTDTDNDLFNAYREAVNKEGDAALEKSKKKPDPNWGKVGA